MKYRARHRRAPSRSRRALTGLAPVSAMRGQPYTPAENRKCDSGSSRPEIVHQLRALFILRTGTGGNHYGGGHGGQAVSSQGMLRYRITASRPVGNASNYPTDAAPATWKNKITRQPPRLYPLVTGWLRVSGTIPGRHLASGPNPRSFAPAAVPFAQRSPESGVELVRNGPAGAGGRTSGIALFVAAPTGDADCSSSWQAADGSTDVAGSRWATSSKPDEQTVRFLATGRTGYWVGSPRQAAVYQAHSAGRVRKFPTTTITIGSLRAVWPLLIEASRPRQ